MNKKLTLNLGVRYEYGTPQWERDNILSNFDPSTLKMIKAKDGSMHDPALVDPDRNNWAPRLGFAYSLMSKAVIRINVPEHPTGPWLLQQMRGCFFRSSPHRAARLQRNS